MAWALINPVNTTPYTFLLSLLSTMAPQNIHTNGGNTMSLTDNLRWVLKLTTAGTVDDGTINEEAER